MAWQDDIQALVYKSPSGTEFTFQYEDLQMDSDKKTAEFIFAELDGALIQDLGRAGRKFPFSCFFSGDTYNVDSDAFMAALEEKGISELTHPLYGKRKVVPTGTITRRDDLVQGANQAVFTFTLSETIDDITLPTSITDVQQDIISTVDNFSQTQAEAFTESIDLADAGDTILLQDNMKKEFNLIDGLTSFIAKIDSGINSLYESIKASFEAGLDEISKDYGILAGTFAPLIEQGMALYRTICEVKTNIEEKKAVVENAIAKCKEYYYACETGFVNAYNETVKNINILIAVFCQSTLSEDFTTRQDAVKTYEDLIELYDGLKTFMDSEIETLGIIDTGTAYEGISGVVSKTSSYLISESFSLPSEKKVVLGKDYNLIELVSNLFKGDMTKLDDFIVINNLTADDIENLNINSEVKYYG